jgi:hypothetical protein
MDFACSPAICILTSFTGPQLNPSANCAHPTKGLPLASNCWRSESAGESTDDMRRKPHEPVSTRILSMVWQFVLLPGAQTVTLVNAPFTKAAVGPRRR